MTMTTDSRSERQALVRERMPDHLDRLTWPPDVLAEHRRDRLRALLQVAVDRSPFHARRLAGIDPDTFELEDLPSLPTMTKTEMMACFDDVVTDRSIARDAVEAHLSSTAWEAAELPGQHLVLASGGSSGERGIFVYSRAAAVDYLLALIRPGLARMVELLGDLPPEPPKVAIVAAGSGVHATRALASLFGGDVMDVHSVAATDPLPSIVDRLNDIQPLLLQGYPSVIRRLATEQAADRLRIAPLSVTCTSEPLSSVARSEIDGAFGVGVCDMFGSSEGLLGVSAPDDAAIVLASDLAIVEPVDDAGCPVPPGTPSARVLLTNLFNPVQPLIRYELTDRVIVVPTDAADGHIRVQVEGRADDELRYGDVVVHPLAVRSVLVQEQTVIEYQVRQTVGGIDVAVVAEGSADLAAMTERLKRSLETAGVPYPEVQVRRVAAEQIERHPHTAKTTRFFTLDR